MAEHSFDLPDADFAAETELLRGANILPTLSSRLRARVLDAATAAYRQARRWAVARQAASFLSVCLFVSFMLSPLVNFSRSNLAVTGELVSLEILSSPQQPNSAWSLRHDRELLDPPQAVVPSPRPPRWQGVARSESSPPRDKLLTALHSSDEWATVQAFQAVRSRSHSTLQRAFAAN